MKLARKAVADLPNLLFHLILGWNLIVVSSGFLLRKQPNTKSDLAMMMKLRSPTVGAYRKNFRGDITKVITEIGNSEVTLPPLRFEDHNWEGHSIELECNASYPVQWVYSGVGAPPVHMRTHRRVSDFFDKATFLYQATVVLTHTTEHQTGNYTCQSLDETQSCLETFLYLFVPGGGVFIADVEEVQNVIAVEDEPWVTLPCAVTDADARVILLKKHSTIVSPKLSGIEVLNPGKHLTFDPKLGFQMQWQQFHDPWVNYSCIGETEDNTELLNIIVRPPLPKKQPQIFTNPPDFDTWALKRRGIKLIVDEMNDRLLCCSSTNERPSIKSTGCTSIPDCNLRQKYLDAKKCPPSCEQHVVNAGRTCVAYEMSDEHDESGMLRCSVGDIVEYFHFSKEQDILITNFTKLPPVDHILSMYVEKSPQPGKLFISCHGNSFFFSSGLKWVWTRPNGSMEIIQDQRSPAPSHLEVDRMKNLGSTIYCFAPISNSATEWKSKSIVIK